MNDKIVKDHGIELVIKELKIKLIEKFKLTSDQLLMLERIGEYVTRGNEHSYFNELIVRLPEFIAKGLDQSALIHLSSLQSYWLNNISPAINESINKLELEECGLCKAQDIDDLIIGHNTSNTEEL